MESSVPSNKPNPFTTVTIFSKVVALILFIALPFTGFYLGTKYQKAITVPPEPDINLSVKNTKTPQNNTLKLEFKDITVTLESQTISKDSWTLFNLHIKRVDDVILSADPIEDLLKQPLGVDLYYLSKTDSFYDIQPGGYSQLRLTDSKEINNLSKSYEKVYESSNEKIKFSCNTFHYPIGSIDALALSCTTTITVLTGGDESTTANCYLPLETGKYLAYEQKMKPIGISSNMCEQLSWMGLQEVTWLKNTSELQEPASPSATWKTYKDETLSFEYPDDWEVGPVQVLGSRSEVDFDFAKTTTFYLSYPTNYNQATGKAYSSLSEYLGPLSSGAKSVMISGQKALLVTSSGDPGHVIPFEQVVLFSPKGLLTVLYYQPGYYPVTGANTVLDKILPTVKFVK